MTAQPAPKKRSIPVIFIGILVGCCILGLIVSSLNRDENANEPSPVNEVSTNTPSPTATIPPTLTPAETYFNEYGGDLGSYIEIFSLTDCALLQEKFDIASDNNSRETAGTPLFTVTLGYMTAADAHMREIGCY